MLERYPDILTIKEIKNILRIGTNLTYKLLQTGKIKSIRLNKKYLIKKSDMIEYIEREMEKV